MKTKLKFITFSSILLISLSFQGLHAEKSAFFIGGMYEVGMATLKDKTTQYAGTSKTIAKTFSQDHNSVIEGFGIHVGYNQLFGKKGWAGFRYYGFYDWGVAKFKDVRMYDDNAIDLNSNFNLSSYGVGIDLLLNVVNFKFFSLGVFGGVAIGGNTWYAANHHKPLEVRQSNLPNVANGSGSVGGELHLKKTEFEWMFNTGIRSVIAKHVGIEAGFKIPMMTTPYLRFDTKDGTHSYSEDLKRNWSFYAAMYFLF
ncbi:outer membrane protein [Helicobacter cetorum]|uniref:outer membrane protein n=1 Tax=Helicobacter cetorum TaxID=138563 RepID=UPI000CF0DD08|nr:outer membrane protein [Helicobacter cetorum]